MAFGTGGAFGGFGANTGQQQQQQQPAATGFGGTGGGAGGFGATGATTGGGRFKTFLVCLFFDVFFRDVFWLCLLCGSEGMEWIGWMGGRPVPSQNHNKQARRQLSGPTYHLRKTQEKGKKGRKEENKEICGDATCLFFLFLTAL